MILATLLVKDEEEIIKSNIEHHLNNGVDKFIITDNNSNDLTKEIIEDYKEVEILIKEKEVGYYQNKWVTRMAHLACDFNPDWVIHLDADEFWTGLEHLKNVPNKIEVVLTGDNLESTHSSGFNVKEYIPLEGCKYGEFNKDNYEYFITSQHRHHKGCKIAHRPSNKIQIWQGNHGASNFDGEKGYSNQIKIDHYPIRSFEHFLIKVRNGGIAYEKSDLPMEFGIHWRMWYKAYKDGKIKQIYDKLCLKEKDIDYYLNSNKIYNKNIKYPIKKSWK